MTGLPNSKKTGSGYGQIGVIAALFFPIGWLVYTVWRYALNVPIEDDFFCLFEDWHHIADSPGAAAKITSVVKQYGFTEHRPAVIRLMAGTILTVTGQIDCRVFIALGVGWLGWLLWDFYRFFRQQLGVSLVYFIPVVWLFMQPQHLHRALLWPSSHSINVLVILVGFWILRALAFGHRPGFWLACALTVVAPFVMSHGLFVGWFGVLLLAYQRRSRAALAYGALVIGLTVAYFAGYHSEFTPKYSEGIGQYVYRFTLLLGGFVNVNEVDHALRFSWFSVGVGLLVLGTYLVLSWQVVTGSQPRDSPVARSEQFLVVCGGWLLLTLLALTVSRFTYSEEMFLQNRYLILPVVLACLVYVWVIKSAPPALRRAVGLASGGVAIVLWGWHQYQAVYRLDRMYDTLTASAFEAQRYGTWGMYHTQDKYEARLKSVTQEMRRRGEYQFPAAGFPVHHSQLRGDSTVRRTPVFIREVAPQRVTELTSQGIPLLEKDRVFFLFDSPERMYLLPAQRKPGGHRKYLSMGQRYHATDFGQRVEWGRLPAATYSLWLGVGRQGQFRWYPTDQRLRLP